MPRYLSLWVYVVTVFALSSAAWAQQAPIGPAPGSLSVLYAGKPDSQRMKDFVTFLEKHFAKVGTHDLQTDFADAASNYDVVVLDWTPVFPRNKDGLIDEFDVDPELSYPKIAIKPNFSKPIVMLGPTAGQLINQLGGQLKLAINYRCLCLENYAHSTNLNHPIFQGPLPLAIKMETVEKPYNYFLHPGMKKIGETIDAWKVQLYTHPYCDPGLVASATNVSQAEDGEAISGGLCGKGPTSVAIARHGNYLLWGFSAPPAEMTPAGQATFVNSLCYMTAFNGQIPKAVRGSYLSRKDALVWVYTLRMTSPDLVATIVKKFERESKLFTIPPQAKAEIGDDFGTYYTKQVQSQVANVLQQIPPDIRHNCQDDPEKIIAYYTENYDYIYRESDQKPVIDEDVRSLGIANNKHELLQRCIDLLEAGENTELAQRVLQRYTAQPFTDAKAWRSWYDARGKNWNFDEAICKFVDLPFEKMPGSFN